MPPTRRLELRALEQDCELIQRAAERAGRSVSDYVRSRVLAAARRELADRRHGLAAGAHAGMWWAVPDDDAVAPELRWLAEMADPDHV